MGRVKRHGRLSAPEVLAAELPAELLMLEFCGTLAGLRAEQGRIRAWLDERVPGRGAELLAPVLTHTGFDVAGWYRRVLTEPVEGCWIG